MIDSLIRQLRSIQRKLDPNCDDEFADPPPEDDRPVLRAFDEALGLDINKSDTTHKIHLSTALTYCRARDEHGISLNKLISGGDDPDAVRQQFKAWVKSPRVKRDGELHPMAPKTQSHYRNMARELGKQVTGGDEIPDHLSTLYAGVTRNGHDWDPAPHPSDVLYWDEHVCPILDDPNVHIRDKALAAVLWDSGARPTEMERTTFNDLTDKDDHIKLVIWFGKNRSRTRDLYCSMPYLRLWLNKHPVNAELDATDDILRRAPNDTVLWTHQEDNKPYTSGYSSITSKWADDLGIGRPTAAKNFRKSRASHLSMDPGITESTLRYIMGWTTDSDAPKHYLARFGEEANNQVARADGADIEDEDDHEDPAPVQCPQCTQWTARHTACLWCEAEFVVKEIEGESKTLSKTEDQKLQQVSLAILANSNPDSDTLETAGPFGEAITREYVEKAKAFLDSHS